MIESRCCLEFRWTVCLTSGQAIAELGHYPIGNDNYTDETEHSLLARF